MSAASVEKVCDVFIYGAGNVGRSVVELARHLRCRIYWIDVDDDRCSETIPPAVIKLLAQALQTIAARAPVDAIHLVMTYSHQLDYDIVAVLLASGEFAQCGLIGSETKATRFRNRLEKRDQHRPDQQAGLPCWLAAGGGQSPASGCPQSRPSCQTGWKTGYSPEKPLRPKRAQGRQVDVGG